MKRTIFHIISIVFLISCNGNSPLNNTISDSNGKVQAPPPPPIPNRDSFALDQTQSSFAVTRNKTVKDVEKQVKLFGSTVNVKMDNASFTANTSIKIKNGCWYFIDKKWDGGKVVLDMKGVSTLQIGKDEQVESGNPEYLEVKKYPTATLTILHIDSIPVDRKKMHVLATLQIKDTTGDVNFSATIEYLDAAHPEVPTKLIGDFQIDGIKWALNPKNAKVLKDNLAFHVVLVTARK